MEWSRSFDFWISAYLERPEYREASEADNVKAAFLAGWQRGEAHQRDRDVEFRNQVNEAIEKASQ